jgi:hypothetical protein
MVPDNRHDVFPFLVGCGRSGTTLLRAMLDTHPDMAIPPESYFVVDLAQRSAPEAPFDADSFLDDLGRHERFRLWGIPPELVGAEMTRTEATSFGDAIRATFRAYATSKGARRYADKTPIFVESIELLSELFEEARFVHLIRDGRDVALSFLEREWGPKTMEEAAKRWRKRVRSGRNAGAGPAADRYVEIRYEDLVAEPSGVLREVCRFIDLDFDPIMLRYHERADEIIAGTKYPEQHGGVARPPTKGARDWRTQMSAADQRVFDSVAGELLDELGYERAG